MQISCHKCKREAPASDTWNLLNRKNVVGKKLYCIECGREKYMNDDRFIGIQRTML
jgi:hypothetical protein